MEKLSDELKEKLSSVEYNYAVIEENISKKFLIERMIMNAI